MKVTSLPRRLLATASLTAALACGGLALTTGSAAAAAPPAPVSAGHTVMLATTDTGSDNHTGRWGLAGLTGMVGLFGYKKYTEYRATRSGARRVGGTDNEPGGSTRP